MSVGACALSVGRPWQRRWTRSRHNAWASQQRCGHHVFPVAPITRMATAYFNASTITASVDTFVSHLLQNVPPPMDGNDPLMYALPHGVAFSPATPVSFCRFAARLLMTCTTATGWSWRYKFV